jgi:4-amino-4-deoxy-L-arabinose transferase-like glycosyltransferase
LADPSEGAHHPPAVVHPSPPWERIAVALLLALFGIVGLNLIGNFAFEGQDYGFHVQSTFRLLNDPSAWFARDFTDRPMIYWIAIQGFDLTKAAAPFHFAAFIFLILNTGALWLLHDATRRFITSPAIRVSALALTAFWPATTVTTVVFAADAMAPPFFTLTCWSILRWQEAATDGRSTYFASLAGVALALGNFAKFTFILLPAGVLFAAFIAWRWRIAPLRRVVVLAICGAVLPAIVGAWLHRECSKVVSQRPVQHGWNWRGTGEMTWGSLLGVKRTDARIFDAPGYWDAEYIDGKRYLPLLRENDYSYPALLHLGTFTDVLDFSNGGNQRQPPRPRPEPQKTISQWSVRLGVLFSVPMFCATCVMAARTVRTTLRPQHPPRFGCVAWLILGLNWYLPLTVTLPFVTHSYQWGYWLPRLVLPGLWAFGVCLFTSLDELSERFPRLGRWVLGATAIQAGLEIASVWY